MYFDPKEVSYEQLLDNFFDKVDPTTKDRQGNDTGTQYRSAIYYHNEQQKEAALKVSRSLHPSSLRYLMLHHTHIAAKYSGPPKVVLFEHQYAAQLLRISS